MAGQLRRDVFVRRAAVEALAATLGIRLQFLPSYSSNLNLIERLSKFVKRDGLSGRHDDRFTEFRSAGDGCLGHLLTKHRLQLATLKIPDFQHFHPATFFTA